MDTTTEVPDLQDVRDIPLSSLGSLAGAGLLNRSGHPAPTAGVSVAAFNSSI